METKQISLSMPERMDPGLLKRLLLLPNQIVYYPSDDLPLKHLIDLMYTDFTVHYSPEKGNYGKKTLPSCIYAFDNSMKQSQLENLE